MRDQIAESLIAKILVCVRERLNRRVELAERLAEIRESTDPDSDLWGDPEAQDHLNDMMAEEKDILQRPSDLPAWDSRVLDDPPDPTDEDPDPEGGWRSRAHREAAEEMGADVELRAFHHLPFDVELFSQAAAWAAKAGVVTEDEARVATSYLRARSAWANGLLGELEKQAVRADRRDVAYGSRAEVLEWGIEQGLTSSEEAAEVARAFDWMSLRRSLD